jgi:hypothetical protein
MKHIAILLWILIRALQSCHPVHETCDTKQGVCVPNPTCEAPLKGLAGHYVIRKFRVLYTRRDLESFSVVISHKFTLSKDCGNKVVVSRNKTIKKFRKPFGFEYETTRECAPLEKTVDGVRIYMLHAGVMKFEWALDIPGATFPGDSLHFAGASSGFTMKVPSFAELPELLVDDWAVVYGLQVSFDSLLAC